MLKRFAPVMGLLIACAGNVDSGDQGNEVMDPSPGAGDTGKPDESDPPPPVEPGLVLRIASGDGEVIPVTVFPLSSKEEPYLRILGLATAADVVDSDYVFQVLDLNGNVVSTDDPACRRFRLNQVGRINFVYEGRDSSGAICTHDFQIGQDNNFVIPLVPFADTAADANGVMHYIVEALPLGGETTSYKLSTPFSVLAPAEPEPTCGDGIVDEGEDCDDGNEHDHDGCSTSCTKDPCHA